MRSRAVRRFLLCWCSIAFCPPPSRIFSSSLRMWETKSARKRILASNRGEVGSIRDSRTPEVDDEEDSTRLGMGRLENIYGITGRTGRANRAMETLLRGARRHTL